MKQPKHQLTLAFDKVQFVPQYSTKNSRLDPNLDLSTNLTSFLKLNNPIISTNMTTISEENMAHTRFLDGGVAFLHRFCTTTRAISMVNNLVNLGVNKDFIIPSIGIGEEDYDRAFQLVDTGITCLLLDIAHADNPRAHDLCSKLKRKLNISIIFGNIATKEAGLRAKNSGASALRVGIAGGKFCETFKVTGFGMPTLQSVSDVADAKLGLPIIADGGISSSGDMVKALAFGADAVCIGTLLAGSDATPGEILEVDGKKFKEHFGCSSHQAQERFKGIRRGIASEGRYSLVPYVGSTKDIIESLLGGIRSGFCYANASNIKELRNNFQYVLL